MYYFVFDEIQLVPPEILTIFKKAFKIPELRGKKMLSIWTGGTQAVLFKKLERVPLNGYSFFDNCSSYNISNDASIENLKELIAVCNHNANENVVNKSVLCEVKKVMGNINCGHLSQIFAFMKEGLSQEQAIMSLVNKIFASFDRDFSNTKMIEDQDENQALAIYMINVFEKKMVEQAKDELGIDVSSFFIDKDRECLTDSLIHIYINLNNSFENGKLSP